MVCSNSNSLKKLPYQKAMHGVVPQDVLNGFNDHHLMKRNFETSRFSKSEWRLVSAEPSVVQFWQHGDPLISLDESLVGIGCSKTNDLKHC